MAKGKKANQKYYDWEKKYKWRTELKRFLKDERKLHAKVDVSECLNKETQKLLEKKESEKRAELGYLVRLLMRFHDRQQYTPPLSRLNRLFFLWLKERFEMEFESLNFRKEALKDGATKKSTKDEAIKTPTEDEEIKIPTDEATINKEFSKYWEEHGAHIQDYFHNVLPKIEKRLAAEFDSYEFDPGYKPASAQDDKALPTLDSFPERFQPMVVIVGGHIDGKNQEPSHVAELFRHAQSYINIHYLLNLKLPPETQIISDRLLLELEDDNERAKEVLGDKHVLVIGSPIVNAFSRHLFLNKKLAFNFVFRKETYNFGKDFYDRTKKTHLLDVEIRVKFFHRLMDMEPGSDIESPEFKDIKGEDREEIKNLVNKIRRMVKKSDGKNEDIIQLFRPTQYFSPFEPTLGSCMGHIHEEFAVVSLGENVWANLLSKDETASSPKALIIASGTNKVSTAMAVKALGDKTALKERPFGGVLNVERSTVTGPKHVTASSSKWIVPGYEVKDLTSKIDQALQPSDENETAFNELFEAPGELESYRDMIKPYLRTKSND